MSSVAKSQTQSKLACIEELRAGRKLGVWIMAAVAAVSLILSLPFVKWIQVVNANALYETLKVSEEKVALLDNSYSLFNMLSFVQHSKAGALGLFASILLILLIATIYFQIVLIVKVLRNKKGKKGDLGLYGTAEASMIFNILVTVLTVVYVSFANSKMGMTGFRTLPFPYIILVISVVGFAIVKRMQLTERALYHEHGLWKELKKNWVLFLFLVPTFIYFIINNYLPMIGIYYAFTDFNFRDGLWASPFVGFKNFEYLVVADLFKLTRNTVLYNIVFIALGNILPIIFAIFVSQVAVKWYKKTTQTLMFMPYFVSFVILKVIIYNVFEYEHGVINSLITSMGGSRIDFYNTPAYWPFLITFFYIWKNIGYSMVVYLATIMGIDAELYDAAKVDGANIFQQIRYITLPQLKPTFIILLLYALGGIMKGQFELFYQMVGNNGLLFDVTDILDTYVYRIAMTQPMSIELGTAAGLYQSVFGFILIMVVNWIVKRKNEEYALF